MGHDISEQYLKHFIERQRVTGFAQLQGTVLRCQIPFPLSELSGILTEIAQGSPVEAIQINTTNFNQLSVEIRSDLPIFGNAGVGWVARNILAVDLTAERLRLPLEIASHTFAWPNLPFLVLRLPTGRAGTALSQALRSSGVIERTLGEWADAITIEGRDMVLDLRWLLERIGWACLGPALKTVDIQADDDILWIQLVVKVDGMSLTGDSPANSNSNSITLPVEESSLMEKILEKHLANGFASFPGLRLNGQVPLQEEVLNELLAEFLKSEAAASDPALPASGEGHSLSPLLRRVKNAQVKVEQGVVLLHFEVAVDE